MLKLKFSTTGADFERFGRGFISGPSHFSVLGDFQRGGDLAAGLLSLFPTLVHEEHHGKNGNQSIDKESIDFCE